MIEKFNFYDVYGYFLPGLALLTLIWLPTGLVQRYWPVTELASALIVIPLAYIVGHLLQSLAASALPSKIKQSDGTARHPSDLFLDGTNDTFSLEFKKELANDVSSLFHLDLGIDKASSGEVARARSDAFFLCRSKLIQSKSASYGEQFEGLYALMRGLTLACGLGTCYHAGWALFGLSWHWVRTAAMAVATLGLLGAILSTYAESGSQPKDVASNRTLFRWVSNLANRLGQRKDVASKWTLRFVGTVLISVGYLSGSGRVTSIDALQLAAIALSSLLLTLRFWRAYRSFAEHFAKAIYRDFYTHRKTSA